jgi:uncharacterized protein YaaR (DUF327 family)
MQWNAEGVRNKKQELQAFLRSNNIDICCIQETHLSENHRFTIRGYETFRQDRANGPKRGVATLVKNTHAAAEVSRSNLDSTESLGIKVLTEGKTYTVLNQYSPPNKPLQLDNIRPDSDLWLMVGDFNSHSPSWGYRDLDNKGEELENWMIDNQLTLINRPDDPPTCYSRAWRTMSTPDLAISTDNIARQATRSVEQQLGGSDHKPVTIQLQDQARLPKNTNKPSWNFKKANWSMFTQSLECSCKNKIPRCNDLNVDVESFTKAVLKAAKDNIPRGKRGDYKPGWNTQLQQLHNIVSEKREALEKDPTNENVTAYNKANAEYTKSKLQQLRTSWHEKTQALDINKDSFKLWQLTKTLNGDRPERKRTVIETNGELQEGKRAANTFAKSYQQASTVTLPKERTRDVRKQIQQHSHKSNSSCMSSPIRMDEMNTAIKALKSKKAPGPDGICNDMIKHFGQNAKCALLNIFNRSWNTGIVPSAWKKAHLLPIYKK